MSVSYPLSSLYKNNHRVKETKLAVLMNQNAEEQKMQQVRVTVRTAFLRHREALRQVEALKLSVKQAEENYRIMQNRYLNQLAILTDLLDANHAGDFHLLSTGTGVRKIVKNKNYGRTENKTRQIEEITDA